MKHEVAMAVVVVAAIGTVGVTVAVGSSVKEPTVVSNPYEAGLHHREAVAAQGSGASKPAEAAQGSGTSKPAEAPRVAPACDLSVSPCVAPAGPYEVRLDLGPRPLRTMADLAAAVELRRDGAPVDGARVILAFDMRDMSMGENRRTLAGAGAGRYTGKAVLVRCPSGRRDWHATVVVGEGSAASTARFDFKVEE